MRFFIAVRSTSLGAILCLAVSALIPNQGAQAVTINFDEIAISSSTLRLTTDHYLDLGVKFTWIPESGGAAGLTVVEEPVFGNGASSNPNSASFGFAGSIVEAKFFDPISGAQGVTDLVSITVGDLSGEPDPITVRAFGINGEHLATRSFTSQPTSTLGVADFGTLVFNMLGIHRLTIADASRSGASFDDFIFSPIRSSGGPNGEIPEPATLGLLISSLIGAGATRRRHLFIYTKSHF